MELKKKNLGHNVFIKELCREVEVSEENKNLFISFGYLHLFDKTKHIKNDSIESITSEPSKRRTKTHNSKS